jgi:hemerythrin
MQLLPNAYKVRSFNVQVDVLRQRERIADAIERVERAVDESDGLESVAKALDDLILRSRAHFDDQEAAWALGAIRQRGWHRDAHCFALEYLERMMDDMERLGCEKLRPRLIFVKYWLTAHFRAEDAEPA